MVTYIEDDKTKPPNPPRRKESGMWISKYSDSMLTWTINNIISRLEYRWYDAYSMIHTAWLGYKLSDSGTVKAGIVRVPFGPTAYGISTSWFFDQHFYVGLADDMDLGNQMD